MIVGWRKKGAGVKIIPVSAANGVVVGKVTLLPGNNEVKDEDWAIARNQVKDEIDRGLIKEIEMEVKTIEKDVETGEIDPKTKKSKTEKKKETVIKAKEFKKIEIKQAIEIVNNTSNLATLEKWRKKEGRDSVRAAIQNQIEEVEKYGEEKTRNKEESKDNDGEE